MDFIGKVIIAAIAIGIALLVLYVLEDSRKKAWRKFASDMGLRFESGFFGGNRVYGKYRGHQVEMTREYKYFEKRNATQIRFNLEPPGNKQFSTEYTAGNRLSSHEIERLLIRGNVFELRGQVKFERNAHQLNYEEYGVVTDNNVLRLVFDILSDVGDGYPRIISLGGDAVEGLCSIAHFSGHPLRLVAIEFLRVIADQTNLLRIYSNTKLFCTDCLLSFTPIKIALPMRFDIHYFGCRGCGQSRSYVQKKLVVVLDNSTGEEIHETDQAIKANWLKLNRLFDFEDVEIVQATDEDVERFAVVIANDTDTFRSALYKKMCCSVSSGCGLSPNTRRILKKTFKKVDYNRG